MSTFTQFSGPVLIFGGNGFLGSHIISQLSKIETFSPKNVENRSIIHSLDMDISQNRWPRVIYHQANDVANKNWRRKGALNEYWWREELPMLLEQIRPSTVFHLASPDYATSDVETLGPLIVDCTKFFLEACKSVGSVKVFIYTIMGRIQDEDDMVDPGRGFSPDMSFVLRDAKSVWDQFEQYDQRKFKAYCMHFGAAEELVSAANRFAGDSSMRTVCIRPRTRFGTWSISRHMAGAMANCLQASEYMDDGKVLVKKEGKDDPTWMEWMKELAQAKIGLAQELHGSWEQKMDGPKASFLIENCRADGEIMNFVYPASFHFAEDGDLGSE